MIGFLFFIFEGGGLDFGRLIRRTVLRGVLVRTRYLYVLRWRDLDRGYVDVFTTCTTRLLSFEHSSGDAPFTNQYMYM
jgi:hypothetical protein